MDFSGVIDQALSRTHLLLWERRSFARWRNYWVLTAATQLNGSGGFNPSPRAENQGSNLRPILICSAVGAGGVGLDSTALVLLGLGMLLGVAFLWVASVARLVLIENIIHDKQDIVEPFKRLRGPGTSVFGWTLSLFLVGLLALLMAGVAVFLALGVTDLEPGQLDPATLLRTLFPLVVLCLFGIACLAILSGINFELVLPIMLARRVGEIGGWGTLLRTVAQAPGSWFMYLLVRFVVLMATGAMFLIVLSLGALAAGLVVGVVVGVPGALLAFTLSGTAGTVAVGGAVVVGAIIFGLLVLVLAVAVSTPFTVFNHCFAIYALQGQAPELQLIPGGNIAPVQEPGFTP